MMNTKIKNHIYSILGPIRADTRPLEDALDILIELLFKEQKEAQGIRLTKDVYPRVAERQGKTEAAVTRSIQRMTNRCWEAIRNEDQVDTYIGRNIIDIESTGSMLMYMVYKIQYNKAFYAIVREIAAEPEGSAMARITRNAISYRKKMPVKQVLLLDNGDEHPICPRCGCTMEKEYQNYCDRCGQRLEWQSCDYVEAMTVQHKSISAGSGLFV